MKFTKLDIPDIIQIQPDIVKDVRGYFTEIYKHKCLESFLGYSISFCQENQTKSSKGVIRGLHFQQAPYGQTKLIRVTRGSVIDVILDIRKDEPTFGKHISIKLSAENNKQILIPPGFAHGFVALEDNTIFEYKVDKYYNPKSERGILFNDQELAIDWKFDLEKLIISEKDSNQPLFKNAEYYEL